MIFIAKLSKNTFYWYSVYSPVFCFFNKWVFSLILLIFVTLRKISGLFKAHHQTRDMTSPMAPDNPTGSFIKVKQRIPVKIDFTDNNDRELLGQLSAGMNAECTVKRK